MARWQRLPEPKKVYSMGRVRCGCCDRMVWVIEYTKGNPVAENERGDLHRTFRPMKQQEVTV